MLGSICEELLQALYRVKRNPLTIIETGTLRDPKPEAGLETEERSTLRIAQWMESNGLNHRFASIDSSAENMSISEKVLNEAGLRHRVSYTLGDSRYALANLLPYKTDFALLDSDTDPHVILGEFLEIDKWMADPGIIVIDDCFKTNIGVNKGLMAVPQARLNGHKTYALRKQAIGIAYGDVADKILAAASESIIEG